MSRPVYRVSELATLLNVSPDFVQRRIREGAIRARMLGRFTVVTQADLDAYIAALPAVASAEPTVAATPVQTQPHKTSPRHRIQRRISLLPSLPMEASR